MGGPPTVNKPDDFELEIPDVDEAARRERLAKEIREAIMSLRSTLHIQGGLSRDLMDLHRMINKKIEVNALFDGSAHARDYGTQHVKCRFRNHNKCILFAVLKLLKFFNDGDESLSHVDYQLARVRAIGANGHENFTVVGDDREGYILQLKEGQGLGVE